MGQPTTEDRKYFALLDKNHNGALSKQEVYGLINRRGLTVSENYIEGIWRTIDVDGDEVLDIYEFATLVKLIRAKDVASTSVEV